MDFKLARSSRLLNLKRLFSLCLSLTFCIIILNRYQLANGFSLLPGDRYDAVIMATILEHWFNVFSGDSLWSQLNYFYPYTNTIAHTDGYFLNGLSYIPFRLMGLDPYFSASLSGWVLKSIGFFGTYILCRKMFSMSFFWALLSAILFTMSNGMTVHSQRLQLASIAFSPIMSILLWRTVQSFLIDKVIHFRIYGFLTGLLFGAWCLTCFYMAFYFMLYILCLFVITIFLQRKLFNYSLLSKVKENFGSIIFVFLTTLISFYPFISAYLPKSKEVGVRSWETVHRLTIPLEGILQVGHENYLFGPLYNYVLTWISPNYSPHGEYYNTGFSLILFFLFICGSIYLLKNSKKTNGFSLLFPISACYQK